MKLRKTFLGHLDEGALGIKGFMRFQAGNVAHTTYLSQSLHRRAATLFFL